MNKKMLQCWFRQFLINLTTVIEKYRYDRLAFVKHAKATFRQIMRILNQLFKYVFYKSVKRSILKGTKDFGSTDKPPTFFAIDLNSK